MKNDDKMHHVAWIIMKKIDYMFLTLSNNKSKKERQYFPKATGNEAAGKEIFSWFGFNQINKLAWFKEKENEVKFVFVDTITTQQMLSSSFLFIYV